MDVEVNVMSEKYDMISDTVADGGFVVGDMGYIDGAEYNGVRQDGFMTGETAKAPLSDRLLGSAVFIGGTGALALAFGIVCGLLLAKRKIKKGIDLYED